MARPYQIFIIACLSAMTACGEWPFGEKDYHCFGVEHPESPYEDPVWHPSGNLIGFNYIPVKKIVHIERSPCPDDASYEFDMDSTGFWTIHPDGTNKKRVLPYRLRFPAWSPDGKWIAFFNDGQIFKMPFDGQRFDTLAIHQLTFEGLNWYPAWSPDGQWIAYVNYTCGTAATPPPPNHCGLLIMSARGDQRKFITRFGGSPCWGNSSHVVYAQGHQYDLLNDTSIQFFDISIYKLLYHGVPKITSDGKHVIFMAYPERGGYRKLFSITSAGKDLQVVAADTVENFSLSPSDEIVYVKYNGRRLDRTQGALWIMNRDGTNKKALTFNPFATTK